MESSILSEVDDTSILRTGLSTPLSLSSQPATASRLLPPRSGLERSDFVHWHIATKSDSRLTCLKSGDKRTLVRSAIDANDPERSSAARKSRIAALRPIEVCYPFLSEAREAIGQ